MKQYEIKDLNQMYNDAEACDKEIFSEQRSHILLCAGEHYSKKNSLYWSRIREAKDLSQEQKIRLTKNHIYKIAKIRTNIILSHASNVRCVPNNDSELQDQKAAELHQSVIEFGKQRLKFYENVQKYASDFFKIGEVAVKLYWDPDAGRFLGYEQDVDEFGNPLFEEDGTPKRSDRPVYSGDIVAERVFGFNLLRAPQAKSMDESPYLIVRKMIFLSDLKKSIEGLKIPQEEKDEMLSKIKEHKDDTFVVFDSNKQSYGKEKDITTLREFYFRPCREYPEGYYYICTENCILFQGKLPGGIFPIVYKGHDEIETTPRHRSPLKQARPFQIEINRAASKKAEHEVTVGDDKVIIQGNTKPSAGLTLPGIRFVNIAGGQPTVLPGRTGDQFINTIESNIEELYNVMMVPEELEEKPSSSDIFMELFKAAKHKKKFIIDCQKFEFFLKDFWTVYLELAKFYFDENHLIPAIGKNEYVNISEFKNSAPLSYQIKIEPMSEDIETVMGKQAMINHVIQYAGGNLSREDIGKLVRLLPFANKEKSFDDFTLDYDRATNIILALDRGQQVVPNKYDNGPYIIKRLITRMSQGDFQHMSPLVKRLYEDLIVQYENLEAEKARKLKALQSDFIPTDGAMIKVAWYVKDPTNPSRSIQATLPANAIAWLVQRLEDQGNLQANFQNLNSGSQAGIAEAYLDQQTQRDILGGDLPLMNEGMVQ